MSKISRYLIVFGAALLLSAAALSAEAYASGAVDPSVINSRKTGPGDGTVISAAPGAAYGTGENTGTGSNALPAASALNYATETVGGETIYIFEGKRYKLGSSWGIHKLSGYSGEESGTEMTASGKNAASGHTISASSELPFGTVLVIKGVSGPYSDAYNGMYVVEDRGGYYIESEKWIDIYFDTYAEADYTTRAGWNFAEAWIAVPID